MASAQSLTDEESRNEFHRVVALQYECVTEVLRELLDNKLLTSNLSLARYIGTCRLHLLGKPYVTTQQDEFFRSSDPNSKDMDVTLLTMLLLAKCNTQLGLNKREKECIKKLREHRNTLAHNSTGRLKDNSLFTETSNDILALARYLKADTQNNIKACIDELKQRVCVRIHSKLDVITFNQEHLRMALIQEEENAVHGKDCSEALLKFNLTRWAKQISRVLDMQKMLQSLRGKNILSQDVFDRVNEVEYECDKAPIFLEYLVKEGSKKQILHFCKALRSQSHAEYGQLLANLIEGRDTEGLETVEEIKKIEENEIRKLLREHIEVVDTGGQTCEDLHIFVEEVLGYDVEFLTLHQIVTDLFGTKEDNGRYEGILIKRSEELTENSLDDDDNVAAMTFQNYAEYVGKQFRCINEYICSRITSAIVEEAIQIETFVDMNQMELKQVFSHYLEPENYKFGIEKQLQRLQHQIRQQLKANTTNTNGTLRQFDKPYHGKYQKCEVSYRLGDEPGIAAHDFVQPPSSKLTKHLIIKKSIRFIAACLNSRRNGTIHFGINRTGRNTGEILGIDFTDKSLLTLIDEVIADGITRCFSHLTNDFVRNVIRCCRPAHVIPVQNQKRVVIEIDIVPFDRHLGSLFFSTLFPPNGRQQVTFFVYERNDIVVIEKEREEDVKLELRNAIKERQILDIESLRSYRLASDLVQRLFDELTRGADYITDIFYPILCTGKMDSTNVLDYDGLKDAFQNSVAVFDFGSSTELRKKMEGGIPMFTVKTADEFDFDETNVAFSEKEKPWIYCNGNDDLGMEVMDADSWTDRRMIPLENVLRHLKKKIPWLHAKVIFLIFEEACAKDPMIEFAREAFIRIFKHQCIIIGETEEVLKAFECEISRKIGSDKVNTFIFSGLNWFDISKIFSKAFKEDSDDVCKLPNSLGTHEELPQNEKGKWKDIEILSMDECVKEVKHMTPEEQKVKSKEEETKFYRGKAASWWNFYYCHHGERDLFSKLRGLIEKKLTREDGKVLVESVEIHHEPGAGGSILGRHLIWHFSQERCIEKPYRCCVVKQITENTVEEIDKFRQYRDSRPRPVIVLLDDEPDGNMFFQKGLHQLAYKTASPGELFGIVINVSRVSLANDPVEKAENGKIVVRNILKHRLSDRERHWFERKYKELEDADVDVNTLIAFNVMRNAFDKKYIKSTVETILEPVPPIDIDVLKVLSLFGTYEIGICLPNSIFDCLLGFSIPFRVISESKPEKVGEGKPFGMRQRKKINFSQPPEILNSHCLSLFACRAGYEKKNRGLRILSQPLAEVVLRYIRDKENLSLEDVVMFVLQHMKYHSSQENDESKRFVEVVCSLFKTREDTGKGKDGVKDKFSRLIFAFFDQENVNTLEEGRESIVRIMEECFLISEDAFVGQQLARFQIIHKKDFDAGEQAIYDSIALCQNNSYLLDTYGQVFKTKMEFLKESNCQRGNKMTIEIACEVINLAFKAIDKFIEGQSTTQEFEKDKINLSCYHMEVRTLVGLLETFEFFECFTNFEDMVEVLTKQKDISVSFLSVLDETGSIQEIVYGGARQCHADDALRFVEERDYQVKIFTVYTEEEVLLLSLRERYERFYRSHGLKYQLKFGYGLKPLMKAYDTADTKKLVEKRFNDAERNLKNVERLRSFEQADFRDLLFYLGYKFLALLRTDCTIDENLYRQLLKYSSKLLDTQRQEGVRRPYLEAYLFFAVFHWPRRNRFGFSSLSSPNTYALMMEEWEQVYKKNNNITTRQQMKNNKGKNYFALSKDSFGLIDLYEIELEWRQKKEKEEGRSRMHVYKDYFWREPFVADRIKRLSGTLNDTGTIIKHNIHYPNGDHPFKIRTFYPSEQLRNRQVTFVLGFTWNGLRAYDVIEESEEFPTSGEDERNLDEPMETVRVKPREVDPRLYQRNDTNSTSGIFKDRIAASKQSGKQRVDTRIKEKQFGNKQEQKSGDKKGNDKSNALHLRSQTTSNASLPQSTSTNGGGQTVKKVAQAKDRQISESPPIQKDQNENTVNIDQWNGARQKTTPKSLQGPSSSFVPQKRHTLTRRTVTPPNISSLQDYPSLGNVDPGTVDAIQLNPHMNYASIASGCDRQKTENTVNFDPAIGADPRGSSRSLFTHPSSSFAPLRHTKQDVEPRNTTPLEVISSFGSANADRVKQLKKQPRDPCRTNTQLQDLQPDSSSYWNQLLKDVAMDFEPQSADTTRFGGSRETSFMESSYQRRHQREIQETNLQLEDQMHIGSQEWQGARTRTDEKTKIKKMHTDSSWKSFDEVD